MTFQTLIKSRFYAILRKKVAIRMGASRPKTYASALERVDALGFDRKKFQLSCDFLCAKFSLTFAVRSVILTFFDISNPFKIAVLTHFAQKGCHTHGCKLPGNLRECAGKV